MEIQTGGGVFELGNPQWRGAQAVLEIQVDGGVKKPCLPSGVWIFFWNNPLHVIELALGGLVTNGKEHN